MKRIVTIGLPGASIVYYGLSKLRPDLFPYASEAILLSMAFIFVVGIILGLIELNRKYDGVFQIDTSNDERDIYRLIYNEDPSEIVNKESVTFRVEKTRLE